MKRLYYFSKSKLQFVEIKNYKSKLVGLLIGSVFVFSILFYGGYNLVLTLTDSQKDFKSLKTENKFLKKKLEDVVGLYAGLNKSLDSLVKVNNDLRVAANLEPISDEERQVGVGGGYFDNSLDFLSGDADESLTKALSFVDEVSRKLEFEKKEYLEISNKLKENSELFKHIPAMKPCDGTVAAHGFGMRMHPILHIRRMHEGVDIIANRGTPIYAPGDGVVDFVGRKGGFGLAIEIDHGFGYRTVYAHLSKTHVRRGQKIKRGELIADVGSSGLSTGPHLHYEVHHNGVKINPADFFFDDLGFFELTHKN